MLKLQTWPAHDRRIWAPVSHPTARVGSPSENSPYKNPMLILCKSLGSTTKNKTQWNHPVQNWGCLVGTGCHEFGIFPLINWVSIIIPIDELHHFSEGWPWPTNQRVFLIWCVGVTGSGLSESGAGGVLKNRMCYPFHAKDSAGINQPAAALLSLTSD